MSESLLDAASQPLPRNAYNKVLNQTPHDMSGVLGTTPVSLNIGASWRWGDWLRTFAASPLTNDSLDKGLDGPQILPGRCGGKIKKKIGRAGNQTPTARLRRPWLGHYTS